VPEGGIGAPVDRRFAPGPQHVEEREVAQNRVLAHAVRTEHRACLGRKAIVAVGLQPAYFRESGHPSVEHESGEFCTTVVVRNHTSVGRSAAGPNAVHVEQVSRVWKGVWWPRAHSHSAGKAA